LRNRIKQALWPLLPKPWASPVMECRYGLWNGLSALYSASGRQLGEDNARPFALNHHLPAETLACKYPGSRSGRTINISALRIAMANFDAALAIVAAVRAHHLPRVGHPASVGLWDLYILSRASIAIIAWQQRATRMAPPPRAVPDDLASLYQFISGIFMICRDMMNDADPRIAANSVLTTAELYDYADAEGVFLSPNGWACAGSVRKIEDFIEYCLSGAGPGTAPEAASLAALVGDADGWYAYALATIELDCFIEAEAQARRANGSAAVAAIYAGLGEQVRGVPGFPAPLPPDGEFGAGVLARQNRILALLGRPTVKRLSAEHLRVRLAG
jgi:hypothetical protein